MRPLAALSFFLLSSLAQAHPLAYGDPDGGTPPATLEQVVARMDLIARTLPADDGIARFNTLYETTTLNIRAAIAAGRFEDAAFMTGFTIRFAGYYFTAVSDWFGGSRKPPQAWRALFESEGRADFLPVQFATAGLEAHIGRDLPVVLSSMFRGAPYPAKDSSRRRDYLLVNEVLSETFEQLRDSLLDGPVWLKLLGDTTAMPWIRTLREAAWLNGEALYKLPDGGFAYRTYLDGLDLSVRAQAQGNLLIKL